MPRGGATGRHVGGLDARRHAAPDRGVVGLTRKPLPEAWSLFLDAVERLLAVAERAGTILALEGSVKSVLRTTAQVIELFDRPFRTWLVCDPLRLAAPPARPRAGHRRVSRPLRAPVRPRPRQGRRAGRRRGVDTAVGTGVFVQAPYFAFLRERRPDLRVTSST